MKIINPTFEILSEISEGGIKELQHIEKIGRVCYKSEDRITNDGESAKKFVKMLIEKTHESHYRTFLFIRKIYGRQGSQPRISTS